MSGAESMGIIPSTDVPATDDVIDAIADIEMKRRETERTAGFPMSCSSALHRLNELLDHEAEALRLRGPDVGHPGNVEAVKSEIGRVKGLTLPKSQNAFPNNARAGQRQAAWRNAARNPARNKGRRTMGRDGGR
jgi:hypothetical protein